MKRSQSSSGLQTPFKDRKTARPDSVAQPVDSRLATNVVYIAANHDRSKCIQGVRNAIEAGATIINISFKTLTRWAQNPNISFKQIWWAQYDYTQGKALAMQVKDGSLQFESLNAKQQELVEAFETRRSAKALDRLLKQKRPPYRGAGPESSQ